MENDYLKYQLGAVAQAVSNIDKYSAEIKNSICVILGYLKANDDFTAPTFGNGYDSLVEELKLLIINLNIKGSIRERANGLIELRTQAFGSIYGRSKSEIEQKLNQKIKEANTKKLPPASKRNAAPTLAKFYENVYLPYKQQTVSENSLRGIRLYYSAFVQNGFDIPLNKITTIQIETFLLGIDKTRTRQIMRGFINNLLTYAKKLEVIKNNPCDNVSQMQHERKNGRAISFQDQTDFFRTLYAADNIPLLKKLYYTFIYLTGTRRNEALSVCRTDIDFENNVLHIPGTKTKKSDRDIPLFPLVRTILLKIELEQRDCIFNLDKSNATHDIKKVTSYHLHELRHTFGTIAICVQKLDPKTVALYMGHADPYMTLNTYTHPEQLDKALFFDGSVSDEQKLAIMRAKYAEILQIISAFLDSVPNSYPKNR